jgi:proteasome alpha subunit
VEICVAQVGSSPEADELYRITYDGSVNDEPGFMAMGGQAESISNVLRARHDGHASLADAVRLAVEALASIGGENGQPRTLGAEQLEVAVLDRARKGRTFRRIAGAALTGLLAGAEPAADETTADEAAPPAPAQEKPTVSAASVDTEDPQPPADPES